MRLSRATTSRCLIRPLGQVGVSGRHHWIGNIPSNLFSRFHHLTTTSLTNTPEPAREESQDGQGRGSENHGASADWVMGGVGQRFWGWGTVWDSALSHEIPSMGFEEILSARVIFRPDPLEFIKVMRTQDGPISS